MDAVTLPYQPNWACREATAAKDADEPDIAAHLADGKVVYVWEATLPRAVERHVAPGGLVAYYTQLLWPELPEGVVRFLTRWKRAHEGGPLRLIVAAVDTTAIA